MSARWIAAAALALALAGCSREGPPPAENETVAEPAAAEPAPAPPPVTEPPPAPPPAENAEEPIEEPVDESAQTQDDADAVGMTTRALPNVEDEEAPVGNSGASERGAE